MKKLLLVITILLLSGCSSKQEEYVNEVEVDAIVNVAEWVAVDENTHQLTVIRQEDLLETFEITQIELLETGWGEFPYESSFIDEKDWGKYLNITKDLFEKISETDSLGGSNILRTGPKAKLIITLQSDNLVLKCEFFQNSSEQISMMKIIYTNSDDINVWKDYNDDFNEIYTSLNELLID